MRTEPAADADLNPTIREARSPPATCQCTDWYAEGQSRIVEVDGNQIVVTHVGRKGRRTRIKIVAPAGAVFRAVTG